MAKKSRRNKDKVGEEKNEDVDGEERKEAASLKVQAVFLSVPFFIISGMKKVDYGKSFRPMKTFWLRSSQLSSERSLICGWIEPERLFLNVESFCIRRRLPIFLGIFLFLAMFVASKNRWMEGWKSCTRR